MYHASDFRAHAREALRGRWGTAILTYFVASLLGVTSVLAGNATGGGGSISFPFEDSDLGSYPLEEFLYSEEFAAFLVIFLVILGITAVIGLVLSVLRCPIQLGYARFNLNLVDGCEVRLNDLFGQFKRTGSAFVMNFLVGLFTALWSLLFLIPGIIKSYSYSMTSFIMVDHPELTATEAITRSRKLMHGNKWRLFCLSFSFIGWELLIMAPFFVCVTMFTTFGLLYAGSEEPAMAVLMVVSIVLLIIFMFAIPVGMLFLTPYQNAAFAAFYRRICEEEALLLQQPTLHVPTEAPVQPYETPANSRPNPMNDPIASYPPQCSGSYPNSQQH